MAIKHTRLLQSQPVLFREIFIKQETKYEHSEEKSDEHIFVLVHGFKGNENDLRLWKNYIKRQYPYCRIITSSANTNAANEGIDVMGQNLAKEVVQKLEGLCKNGGFRMSFIGYSLGGVIVRAALPYLKQFKANMHSYITLGSPHLLLKQDNSLVNTGFWFMKTFQKNQSLIQLGLEDSTM